VHKGAATLISETTVNTDDEISKARQYEARRDQEVRAGSMTYPGPPAYKLAGPECW